MMADKTIQRFFGQMIQKNVAEPMQRGECGLTEDEIMAFARSLCHIEKNIAETCHLLNDCDAKTLKRWEDDKKLGFPRYHKDAGGKHFYWLDEIELWKMEHPEVLARVDEKHRKRY